MLTRRQFLLSSASLLAAGGILNACGTRVIATVVADSLLYFEKEFPKAIAEGFAGNFVYDKVMRWINRHPQSLDEAIEASGANQQICKYVAQLKGDKFVINALNTNTAIWLSDDKKARINRFKVTMDIDADIYNPGGQIKFAVIDKYNNEEPVTLWADGFAVITGTRKMESMNHCTKPISSGSKVIKAIKCPEYIRVNPVNVEVISIPKKRG